MVNWKILASVLVVLVLLAVYLSLNYREIIPKEFEQLNATEKVEYLEQQSNAANDEANYNAAMNFQDRAYCSKITDQTLKDECVSRTPAPAQEQATQQPAKSEQQIRDEANYNAAKNFNDRTFCDRIIGETLKQQCLSEVP